MNCLYMPKMFPLNLNCFIFSKACMIVRKIQNDKVSFWDYSKNKIKFKRVFVLYQNIFQWSETAKCFTYS